MIIKYKIAKNNKNTLVKRYNSIEQIKNFNWINNYNYLD